jgi:methylmalonyl-CoA mutase
LAFANEYMSGLNCWPAFQLDDAAKPLIKFQFGGGLQLLYGMAKVTECNTGFLWAQIVAQYKPANLTNAYATIHAETSNWNKTVYDPYVNMLRTQTEAMSAILGGVDSFTVKPFNAAYQQNDEFGERIARNQQILLKEEAHFDKVVDPGAGSYISKIDRQQCGTSLGKLFHRNTKIKAGL